MGLSDLSAPLLFVFVLAAVFVVIAIVGWLVRRFSVKQFGVAAPRLAVMDAASVDGRRRLLIIRRDNVEHLLIIGGPTDVVVETNIVRGKAAATAREAAPVPAAVVADTLPRTRPRAPAAAREYGEHRQEREDMAIAASIGSARAVVAR